MVADRSVSARESMDGITLCGTFMLLNGLIGLGLPKPQIGIISVCLGLLLLLRIEIAVVWVKALQFVKLIIIAIMFIVAPQGLLLLGIGEALLVLGLLSSQERLVRICAISFGVLILLGILAVAFPYFAS